MRDILLSRVRSLELWLVFILAVFLLIAPVSPAQSVMASSVPNIRLTINATVLGVGCRRPQAINRAMGGQGIYGVAVSASLETTTNAQKELLDLAGCENADP